MIEGAAVVSLQVPSIPVLDDTEEEEAVKQDTVAPIDPPSSEKQPPPASETKPTAAKGQGGKKKGKKKNFKSSSNGKGRTGPHIDILGTVAMENAMYICHNVQDLLAWRGYPWLYTQTKTAGKKK